VETVAATCEERAMDRCMISAAVMATVCCIATPRAEAQTAKDLVGTWTLVSADIHRSGYRIQVFGPDPSGRLMFGGDGRYALVFLRRGLPTIASHDRTSERPDESQAVVQGSIAHFGTYAVDGDALVFHIEGGTFPNWTGADQRRKFALVGDKLDYTSPGSTGFPTQVTMRRNGQ
jgi:hypothetical protein